MKSSLALAFVGLSSIVFAGCPIYDNRGGCYDDFDCPAGNYCGASGYCVGSGSNLQHPRGRPLPMDGGGGTSGGSTGGIELDGGLDTSAPGAVPCGNPRDCAAGDTCAADGFCHPGGCSPGVPCINGFVCSIESAKDGGGTGDAAADVALVEDAASDGSVETADSAEAAMADATTTAADASVAADAGARPILGLPTVCVRANPNGCGADGDCPSGQSCVDGACASAADLCSDMRPCSGGKSCVLGRCYDACTAADAGACAPGFGCDAAVGICSLPSRSCQRSADCSGSGDVCVSGACVPRCGPGGGCGIGAVCVDSGCVPRQRP